MTKPVNIYTDGACAGNQHADNVGGWGAILEYGEHRKELFGGEARTTNNRMEMTALIAALGALTKPGRTVRIFSDSAYMVDCFRKGWHRNWRKNGWRTAAKTEVENRDLWETLLGFADAHDLRFFKVKGHVNVEGSEAALRALFAKFAERNGADFSYEDFLYVTRMNNRADALANMGIAAARETQGSPGE